MDYLRRDSYHLGVQYGMFDVERILSTLTLVEQPSIDDTEESTGQLVIGIEEGGLLAVESLILARYYMYEQVYFHKVRRYLDLQYVEAMGEIAAGKLLPPEDLNGLQIYLDMDDWTVQAELLKAAAAGNESARRLTQRETMKVGYEMKDAGKADFLGRAEQLFQDHNISYLPDRSADKESQKFSLSNIYVQGETSFKQVRPIVECSRVATAIPDKIYLGRLFVSSADRHRIKAEGILDGLLVEQEGGKDNE
jgi:HD superfamily phosphohydrolase